MPFRNEAFYYLSVTAHGVLMALVFTTFFIMGLGYLLVRQCLGRIALERFAWVSTAPERRDLWDRFGLWTLVAIALLVISYAVPIYHLYTMHRYGSIGYPPF